MLSLDLHVKLKHFLLDPVASEARQSFVFVGTAKTAGDNFGSPGLLAKLGMGWHEHVIYIIMLYIYIYNIYIVVFYFLMQHMLSLQAAFICLKAYVFRLEVASAVH